MVGHARTANRGSEVVISNTKTLESKRIITPTPRKTGREVLNRARSLGWVVVWRSGFMEASSTIGRNSYRLKRGDETCEVDVFFPISPDLYLGAM